MAAKGQPTLPPKQAKFVAEYLVDLNAKQAAIRAGYSPKTAEVQGCRLLRDAHVAALIAVGKAAQLERADLTAMRVLEELRRDDGLITIRLLQAKQAGQSSRGLPGLWSVRGRCWGVSARG